MVDTDAKRIASFKRGLGPKIMKHVGTNNRARFNDFISDCLKQEKNNNAYTASKTCKRAFKSGLSQPRVFNANRPAYRPSAPGARFRPPHHKTHNYKGPQKPYKMAVPPARTAATTRPGNSKGAIGSAGTVKGPYYNCDQPGHFSKFYPYPPRKKQQTYNARVHHTTVDEIPEGEPVTVSKFPVNQNPAVVLFDSRSLHSFMSQAFAQKHEELCIDLSYGYRISSAGDDVLINQMVRGATLELGSQKFRVNLIVMPRLVLDVIIWMNWMKDWGAVIDTGSQVLTLKDPQGEGTFQVPLPKRTYLMSVTCAMEVIPIHQIPVVCEFPDVFPDELPGLPPDRDVEFGIELIPRTASISRRPYRMPPDELAELKKQLEELLKRGLSSQVSLNGDVLPCL
jgi:hypothetical protein